MNYLSIEPYSVLIKPDLCKSQNFSRAVMHIVGHCKAGAVAHDTIGLDTWAQQMSIGFSQRYFNENQVLHAKSGFYLYQPIIYRVNIMGGTVGH